MNEARHTLGALRAPSVSDILPTWKPHAVAPGGPPEGQCRKEQELVCKVRKSTELEAGVGAC
jgi:hypothetical protein